ncbi:uncharacterized protein ARMOST_15181 [Armillaria ostoyae]|uniref:Uncharacterized protein n=1 Tax=Armillaria ostoyae TaxID=47428 RepID=A0A284RSN0_ARMOS|nr:uncharacterized protein ARMOST_15181 [Armillaria ostoyae]
MTETSLAISLSALWCSYSRSPASTSPDLSPTRTPNSVFHKSTASSTRRLKTIDVEMLPERVWRGASETPCSELASLPLPWYDVQTCKYWQRSLQPILASPPNTGQGYGAEVKTTIFFAEETYRTDKVLASYIHGSYLAISHATIIASTYATLRRGFTAKDLTLFTCLTPNILSLRRHIFCESMCSPVADYVEVEGHGSDVVRRREKIIAMVRKSERG